jgi:hypothetical protein
MTTLLDIGIYNFNDKAFVVTGLGFKDVLITNELMQDDKNLAAVFRKIIKLANEQIKV